MSWIEGDPLTERILLDDIVALEAASHLTPGGELHVALYDRGSTLRYVRFGGNPR